MTSCPGSTVKLLSSGPIKKRQLTVAGTATGRGQYDRTRDPCTRGGQNGDGDHRRTTHWWPHSFVAHTRELVLQARGQFFKLWPDVSTGLFLDEEREIEEYNLVRTVQSLSRHLSQFTPEDFDYLIIDEAHHATADTYQKLLRYFRPKFTLGLTATPDRADGLSALEVFRNAAHRLSFARPWNGRIGPDPLRPRPDEFDLSRVRFNQIQYNRRDIEERVLVPSRDQLIVDTYSNTSLAAKRSPSASTCAMARIWPSDSEHRDSCARRFRQDEPDRSESLPRSVCPGRAPRALRVRPFERGLGLPGRGGAADGPPDSLKVIYLQQIGRGTRKAPGKECLIVFDFVDNANRYNQSLSLHRILGKSQYNAGSLVLVTAGSYRTRERSPGAGRRPHTGSAGGALGSRI